MVHRVEEAADEVPSVFGAVAFFEEPCDEVFWQQVDVFGEKRDEDLQDEALRGRLVDLRSPILADEAAKAVGKLVGSDAGNGNAIVFKRRFEIFRKEEGQRSPAIGEFDKGDLVFRRVHLSFEVVNPEFIKVAEDNVTGAIGDEADPVVEGLAVVLLKVFAALFHFDEDNGLPNQIGKRSSAAILSRFANADFEVAANIKNTRVVKRLKEAFEKNLCLPFFVAGDAFAAPFDEVSEFLRVRHSRQDNGRRQTTKAKSSAKSDDVQVRALRAGACRFKGAAPGTHGSLGVRRIHVQSPADSCRL